jgi:hypothetical protein
MADALNGVLAGEEIQGFDSSDPTCANREDYVTALDWVVEEMAFREDQRVYRKRSHK